MPRPRIRGTPRGTWPPASGGAAVLARLASGAEAWLTNPSLAGLTLAETLALAGVLTPAQITSNQDDYAPTGHATATVFRLDTNGILNLTGLAGGVAGRVALVEYIGSNSLTFKNDVTSTAANRFYTPGSADFTLKPGESTWLWYDGTSSRWRVMGRRINLAADVQGTLPAANGGTAFSTWTAGDLLYASATNTLAKLGIGTGPKFLGNASGLPAWAALALTDLPTIPLVKIRSSANLSVSHDTGTWQTFDTDDDDTDNMHYTSAANLTGTVSKTASSATLTGSSTAFTTELSVGQLIQVPGTAAEKRVVTAIASDTSLTVNTAYANNASGQTAKRLNTAIVFRTAGRYLIGFNAAFASNATGYRSAVVYQNDKISTPDGTLVLAHKAPAVNGDATNFAASALITAAQWDWIELRIYQNSGGSLNSVAAANATPVMWAVRVGA